MENAPARNVERNRTPLQTCGGDCFNAAKFEQKLRVERVQRPQVVAVAISKGGRHLFVAFTKAALILHPNRGAKAQQDEQRKAAKADGKEPFGEGHAAAPQKSGGSGTPRSAASRATA